MGADKPWGNKVPCIYVGTTPLRLSPVGGPYYDGLGQRMKTLDLWPGDTLMMSVEEVNGMTFWHDPAGVLDSEKIGAGRLVKPEHAEMAPEALAAIGYEFHGGREDFLTVEQYEAQRKEAEAAAKKAKKAEATASSSTTKEALTSASEAANTGGESK